MRNSRSASTTSGWPTPRPGLPVATLLSEYSEVHLGRFYAELDRGHSLDEASRSALKISEAELITRWRAYLVRLARASVIAPR